MTDQELEKLMTDLESDRVERKESLSDGDKIRQAICAFANDMSGSGKHGVLFIGVSDSGAPTGIAVTDSLLLNLGGIRSEGRILPIPTVSVEKRTLNGKDVAVMSVQPSFAPPVRFDGRVWIRVGPRRAIASIDDERRLSEKRMSLDLSFDEQPVRGASISDLNLDYFRDVYLKRAVSEEVIKENGRAVEHQLATLRFLSQDFATPTPAGLLVLGDDPKRWMPGAYIQFVSFAGTDRGAPVRTHRAFNGSLSKQLDEFNSFLPFPIEVARLSMGEGTRHTDVPDYAEEALRELVYNAVMHRNYQTSNAPTYVYWFNDRVEITNPGGAYGRVTNENYEFVSDYRNPVIADAMKILRYVERFGIGVTRIKSALARNGNAPAEFRFEPTSTMVTVRKRPAPWKQEGAYKLSIEQGTP